jgi:hypothetical protein
MRLRRVHYSSARSGCARLKNILTSETESGRSVMPGGDKKAKKA